MEKKRFEWVITFILSYVAGSMYMSYVLSVMAQNINAEDTTSGKSDLMNAWVAVLLLTPITCGIFGIVWYIKFFTKLVAVAEAKGVQIAPTNNPVLLWLIMCVPVYSFYVLCEAYNKTIVD